MCSFLVWKNACLNYREFDLEDDLVGVPHTWYLSAQSFITLPKLVSREYDIVAMNEWKKKCVGLQWTWVSKRTVYDINIPNTKHYVIWNDSHSVKYPSTKFRRSEQLTLVLAAAKQISINFGVCCTCDIFTNTSGLEVGNLLRRTGLHSSGCIWAFCRSSG